ncbi:hypothetical protein HanXRQr2_Chr08g0351141 [Helianthus annuus]|uniref:Uncharacterized protein n=1 Tax=Helianthus annuus TaxID=4232 RepID=A0A251U7R0_HELAN|nr:hypothetical protein HanXRQr2_Chr08g0351141 [Helianthus annuus]
MGRASRLSKALRTEKTVLAITSSFQLRFLHRFRLRVLVSSKFQLVFTPRTLQSTQDTIIYKTKMTQNNSNYYTNYT